MPVLLMLMLNCVLLQSTSVSRDVVILSEAKNLRSACRFFALLRMTVLSHSDSACQLPADRDFLPIPSEYDRPHGELLLARHDAPFGDSKPHKVGPVLRTPDREDANLGTLLRLIKRHYVLPSDCLHSAQMPTISNR